VLAERTHVGGAHGRDPAPSCALPRLAALRGIRERLAPLAAVPEAPSGWANEAARAEKGEIELDVQTQAVAEEVDRLVEEFKAIAVDERALRLSEQMEPLRSCALVM